MAKSSLISAKSFRSYLVLKSTNKPDLKIMARDFYKKENKRIHNRIDDKIKLDPAKFVNPIKPIHLGLQFAMQETQFYVDQTLLPGKKSNAHSATVNDSIPQSSSTSQSIVKGLLIAPLWLLGIPIGILDKLADDIFSPLFWGGEAVAKNNGNVIRPLDKRNISSWFKDTYGTDDADRSSNEVPAIDPLKVINPFKALRMELSLLAVQTAGLFDNLFPSHAVTASIPSRLFKAILVTPLIVLTIPVRIIENITDTLLSPLKPIVKWAHRQISSSSALTNTIPLNLSTNNSPIDSTQVMRDSGIISWHHTLDDSEHGLSLNQLQQLQQYPQNAANLERLNLYQQEYKDLIADEENAKRPETLRKINEKVNEIQALLDELKKRLPVLSGSPAISSALSTIPRATSDDKNKPDHSHTGI